MPGGVRGTWCVRQQESDTLCCTGLTLSFSRPVASEEVIFGNHIIRKVQEGNPDGNELHKANAAFLRNFPLVSYTGLKVVFLPGAFMPAPCDWYLFRLNNHLC